MNSPLIRFKIFAFFLFFIAIVFSCTKIITTDIGSGLLPPVDGVITKDTVLDVITKNSAFDTVVVGISDDHVLGYTDDPIFGKTTASVNFQVGLPYTGFSWGLSKDSVVLDSVVLCLAYKGNWGDTIPHLRLHVYKMDPEVIFKNTSYYNNTETFEKAEELTEFNTAKDVDITRLNDIDTTSYYTEPTTNQLRIKLDSSFGRQLINYDSATVYQSDSTFYNYLRGLIVQPEQTGNALIFVNLLDTSTHLSLYYHSKDLKDTLTRRFSPNVLTSASSNSILRNYDGTQILSYVNSTETNQDLVFMQTSPGVNAILKIPGLSGMPNVIVHRAEVLMYQVPDPSDATFTPPNLFLAAYNSDSMRSFTVPYDVTFSGTSISNLTAFGVLPKQQTDRNTGLTTYYYSFDISRYVQNIVTRHDSLYDFKLFAPYNQYIYTSNQFTFAVPIATPSLNKAGVGRIRLGGGTNPNYKMRLHIVYSLP